jgi:DNA-directed RNA polymerase subunit N (RpoN/RPB10)
VFGNVGGMAAFVGLFFGWFVNRFAELNLRTIVIKSLYKQRVIDEFTTKKKDHEHYKGEVHIAPPDNLECLWFYREVLCRCLPCVKKMSPEWVRYHKKVDHGYEDLLYNLDVINYIRRIKSDKFT